MNRIPYIALAMLLLLTGCTKEEGETPLPSPPVVTMAGGSTILTTKAGRGIEIRPDYENADEALFRWETAGRSATGRRSASRRTSRAATSSP